MFTAREVTVHYGKRRALEDFNLHLEPGECVLLTGPSGGGKSTVARIFSGVMPHALPGRIEGLLEVDGLDPREYSLAEIALHTGIVFQNPASQLFNLTVTDEIAFGPRNRGLDAAAIAERVTWALQACDIAHLRDRPIRALSGGEKQRVAIASVLAMQPRALILDEPTSGLDLPGTQQIIETLQTLHAAGTTLLVIEHRLGEVAPLAARTVLLAEGRSVADGPTDAVLSDAALIRQLGIRRLPKAPRRVWETLLNERPSAPPRDAAPLITLKDVRAGYPGRPVLHDLSLTIYEGDFLAVVGDNGAGKTTLARLLAGLLKPQHGTLTAAWGRRTRPGLDVGLLFQDPLEQLFCDTVAEEVAFGAQNYGLYEADFQQQLLEEADLHAIAQRSPLKISSGQQQRTALAAVLSVRPRLIILDEPTLGQDWRHLERLMTFLSELNRRGHTILLITHDYRLVYHYARRVIILRDGHVTADGARVREWEHG